MRELRRALLVLVPLIVLCPVVASAQYRVLYDVHGSTGGTASGSHRVWFTAAVADSDVPTDRGMSTGDISAERAASIDANNDRIERELAAMRDRIAALESELGNK